MDHSQPTHVLFICNDNAARSIMAASLLDQLGKGRFKAYSAGSRPTADGLPDVRALQALADAGMPTEGLRSKNWEEYALPTAPHMDLIITLCDDTAGETCPVWPGHPATAQWSYPDPRAASLNEDPQAFVHVLQAIRRHIDLLVNLPDERIDHLVLESEARQIGRAHA